MGDVRYNRYYQAIRDSPDPVATIRRMADEGVIAALAAAATEKDAYLANVLATEALNRVRRAGAIIRHLAEGIFATDGVGRVTFLNEAAQQLLGWSGQDLLGAVLHDALHLRGEGAPPHDDDCPIVAALQGETTVDVADEFPRSDGTWLPVSYTAAPIRRDGDVVGIVLTVRDATAWRHAARAAARQDAILEAALDAIVVMDATGRITSMNGSAVDLFGWSREEAVGREMAELIIPERMRAAHRAGLARFLGTGQGPILNRRVTVDALRRDGHEFPVELTVVALPDADPPLFAGFVRDLSAQAAAQRALAESEARYRRFTETLERRVQERTSQLQAANRELEAFSYSVSHDLRAPLRAVDYLAGAIAEDYGTQLPEPARQMLAHMREESLRASQLVEDLLKLARVARGPLARETIDLSEMARDILDDFRRREPDRSVRTRVEDGVVGTGDPRLVRVLLENLLGNAWKFTARAADPQVEFAREERDGEQVFVVRDNGAGFDALRAEQLFTPFKRFHAATEYEGTGVGLATVQRIVHRHGGRVWAESRPGQGATFRFTLGA